MSKIYVDNASTTKMSARAREVLVENLDIYANPSSIYSEGAKAQKLLEGARESVAKSLGAGFSREIYFTSGATESCNWAAQIAKNIGNRDGKKHILTSAIEHHAVLHSLEKLRDDGFEIEIVPVASRGIVDVAAFKSALREDTIMTSIMLVNNEIGTIQPIEEIAKICKEHGVLLHSDATAAAGKIQIDIVDLGVDMLSISAHKFYGPKGVGAFYCKKTVLMDSFFHGGAQERGKRGGTENLPAVMAMATALEESILKIEATSKHLSGLVDKLRGDISKIPKVVFNGEPNLQVPGFLNCCFRAVEGESLLLLLDMAGIMASSGSACTSGSLDPSHVLLAIGLPHEIAHGSLRISLSSENTEEEIDEICENIPKIVARLREMSPLWNE